MNDPQSNFTSYNPDANLGLHRRRVEIPSGNVAYIDEGVGLPIVLLHGAPATSLAFVRVVRALAKTRRVIAPDLPGFGGSSAAATFDGSLSAYAASIEEFITALDLRHVVLFAMDSSGCIGLATAAAIAPNISGLIIADTVPIPLTGSAWVVKMVLKYVVSSRVVRWLNRWLNLLPWAVVTLDPLRRPFSRRERAVFTSQYDSAEKRDRIIDMFHAMGVEDEFMHRTAAEVRQKLADKPALLLYGQFDPMRLIGSVRRFRAMFEHTSVSIIAKEKHFPILGAGEQVAAAIEEWIQTIGHVSSQLPTAKGDAFIAEAPESQERCLVTLLVSG